MKNILVPTDFSDNAGKALDYAARLATRCGSILHMLHTYTPLENVFIEKSTLRDAHNQSQLQEKTAALLREKEAVQIQYPNLQIEAHLFTGPLKTVIQKYVDDNNIDLIVMGTQGASGLAEVIIGSETASVMEESTIPVLAVPAAYKALSPENILLAVKDFNKTTRPIKLVFDLAIIYDVPVHVFAFESDMNADVEIARRTIELENFLHFLQKEFPLNRFKGTLYEDENFELAIEEYCIENNIGMLCMLTQKRGFWRKLFDPSLTKKMAFQSTIPLLAIPC